MHATYSYPRFGYRRSADQDAPGRVRHPVVIVGGGPVGLSTAIDLALQGVRVVLLDEDDTVSVGSRAVCYANTTWSNTWWSVPGACRTSTCAGSTRCWASRRARKA